MTNEKILMSKQYTQGKYPEIGREATTQRCEEMLSDVLKIPT